MLETLASISKYILISIAITGFFVGIKYKDRHKELSHLHFYTLASATQSITYMIFTFLLPAKKAIPINLSIHVFIIIEVSCIFLFFYKTAILTKNVKKYLLFLYSVSMFSYIFSSINSNFLMKNVIGIYYIESLIILTPCFIYLFQLFLKPPILNLLEEPSFWFNSGILIYFILTFPLFFMIDYFVKSSISSLLDIVNYSGYSLIFSFLIRAYLCKPKTAI